MSTDDSASTNGGRRKRGRPRKFDDETALAKLIDAGARRLREIGYSPGLDSVSLERAIRDAEVPRGAAYRLWSDEETPPQELFRNAVLLRMFDPAVIEGLFETLDSVVLDALDEVRADIAAEDKELRRYASRVLILRISEALDEAIMTSDAFRMARSLASASPATITVSPEVRQAMERSDEILKTKYADMLRTIFEAFDSTVRPPFTFEHLVELGSALHDGLHNQIREAEPTPPVLRPTGRRGELEPWPMFAIGFESLITFFSENGVLRSAIDEER